MGAGGTTLAEGGGVGGTTWVGALGADAIATAPVFVVSCKDEPTRLCVRVCVCEGGTQCVYLCARVLLGLARPARQLQEARFVHYKRELQQLVAGSQGWVCAKCTQPLKTKFPRLASRQPWIPVVLQNTSAYCEACFKEKQAWNKRDRIEKGAKLFNFTYKDLLDIVTESEIERMRAAIAAREQADREAAVKLAQLYPKQVRQKKRKSERPQVAT